MIILPQQQQPQRLFFLVLVVVAVVVFSTTTSTCTTWAFSTVASPLVIGRRFQGQNVVVSMASSKKEDDNNEAWDANVDYDKEWPTNHNSQENGSSTSSSSSSSSSSSPDPSTAWDALPNQELLLNEDELKRRLGINVQLEPLSEEEAAKIKEQAKKIINDQIDLGIQDIEKLKQKMNRELQQTQKALEFASEVRAQEASKQLLGKIDQLTDAFLSKNKESRTSTKLAAAANQAMENTNRGIEMGTWGTLQGRTVLAESSTGSTASSSSLLGSVDNAVKQVERAEASSKADGESTTSQPTTTTTSTSILILADTKQDPLAKQLVPVLMDHLLSPDVMDIPGLTVNVLSPTDTMPLGGNNAACVVVFCTSFSQSSSVKNALERLLRKTMTSSGQLGTPPTQILAISTLGTQRIDQFPYSMQNLLGGGKLEARRQIEEVIVNTVKNRVTSPPLDYTLVKVGEKIIIADLGPKAAKQQQQQQDFSLQVGDVLDDPTTLETAALTIVQAMAYQPFARNATLSVSGSLPSFVVPANDDDDKIQEFWNVAFLPLQGPEIYRMVDVTTDTTKADELVEYLQEWADVLATTRKGLTTPIEAVLPTKNSIVGPAADFEKQQLGVQLLFLPTQTGRNYMSKEEERQRESASGSSSSASNANSQNTRRSRRQMAKEGGIDVLVETIVASDGKSSLRVRARRCNYGPDAIVKELSEKTILKRLEDALEFWKKEHA